MKAGVMSAACIVVFVTTYALILPAITISLDQASEMPGFDTAFSGELLDTDDGMEDGILSGDDGDTQGSGGSQEGLFGDDGDEIFFAGGAAEGVIAGFGTDTYTEKESISEDESITENEASAADEEASEGVTESITADKNAEQIRELIYEGEDYTIRLAGGADVHLPEDAYLSVREIEKDSDEYQMYLAASGAALQRESGNVEARFFDITIMSGGEAIEPEGTVSVDISYHDVLPLTEDSEIGVVHFEDGAETATVLEADPQTENGAISSVSFDTDSFSVFGIIYTVDLHYDVDGEQFTASIPGGGYVSIRDLVETLNIPVSYDSSYSSTAQPDGVPEKTGESSKAAGRFVQEIENITFSSPELLYVSKAEAVTTVGEIRDSLGLEPDYSADLTEDEIQQINVAEIAAGDWVLISLRPFETEETLTVTMKNGDVFTVLVTDAQLHKTVISASGEAYEITVAYDDKAGIPEGAELSAREIMKPEASDGELLAGTPEGQLSYEEYAALAEQALGLEEGSASYIRLFDISIVKDGEKIQPAACSNVDVRIELADSSSECLNVVHFMDGSEEGEQVQSSTGNTENGAVVEFRTDSFSVYSIVEAPEPVTVNPTSVATLEELALKYGDSKGFILSYGNNIYFTNTVNGNNAYMETNNITGAGVWFFEPGEENNTYYVYTMINDEKKYMYNVSGYLMDLSNENKTLFTLSESGNGSKFYFKTNGKYLQHSNSGKGMRLHENQNSNGQITITYVSSLSIEDDVYKLDGKTFGIAYNDNSVTAAALMAESKQGNRLGGLDLLIRTDVLGNSGNLLVAENSDIQEWTFEAVEQDKYYIRTTVDGTEKYLHINNANVTLVDDRSSASAIQATPGTDANSGKWHFTVGGYSLNFAGSAANGFNAANNSNATTWLNLVEKSALSDEDFVEYSARKISASDDILSATEKDENGQIMHDDEGNVVYREKKTQVVIYTRVWNETTKKYEFYAVDHDGSLIRVYDSGDQINWIGNQVNSALWEFTEYTNDDGTPTYFYELENTAYTGTYLAPQSESIVASEPVGINLNGRREGFDYSSIVAWDDPAYAYSGLKIERNEDGSLKVVPCPLDEAADFHFAVITPPVEEADPVTTVATVDNDEFGISIRMTDFNNGTDLDNRDPVQRSYLGHRPWSDKTAYTPETGLVSTNLTGGYPTVTANTPMNGNSLSGLFNNMTPANHLFIQSAYNESGYFEYDSTQNFAHLNDDGTFTVYNQLGAIGTSTGPTRVHGQFMPYNDISAETGYAHDSQGNVITNQRNIRGQELPDTDPRKGEPLYSIPQNAADYYFGMELSAVFTQTPDGVDNWGHDIIFEFTGDDDFWFYVDGELVLDLGGVHSALGGSVNFRTGEVVSNGTTTSLYEIFKSNYQARGLDVSKVDELFVTKEVNGNTVHVFNDYTTHEMKMFYMERGAGASNLKMRFNLASVKPGTVELSKKLKGIDNASNKLIQYPYQIWYQTAEYEQNDDGTYVLDENGNRKVIRYNEATLLSQPASNTNLTGQVYASYKGTKTLIPYKDSMTIGGITYNNVFLLKAGETAVINFPENTYRYKLVECGVDTSVYGHVYVNGDQSDNEIFGKAYNNSDGWDPDGGPETLPASTTTYEGSTRSDFGITYYSTEGRPRAEYTNEVPPEVMRTLSFKKVLYDTKGKRLTDAEAAQVPAAFNFRLFLGNEFADQENLLPADMYTYYIKGPDQNYCKWDKANQKFVSLGVDTFEGFKALSEADQHAGTFTTSMYGSISKIPAGYIVEVRDLIVGTKYKIDEPDRELPRGYTRRDGDGYVRTDLAEGNVVYYTDEGTYGRHPEEGNTVTAEPISDTIADKTESPKIEIRNQEGWGLTAKKEWTDKDFMIHDPVYLAVYLDDGNGNPGTLIDGTVRRLNSNETEVYWFFPDLKIGEETYTFDKFIVREVKLTVDPNDTLSVDEKGVVTGYSSITPIADGGSISVSGRTFSGTERTENYIVNYQTGGSTGQNENIRTDTITNSRPGIQIYKTDWSGENYLSGAVFTLKDSGGHDVGHASYTSGRNGLVTTAYLNEGTFTLDEIKTPAGYAALDEPITITVTTTKPESYDLTVASGSTTYYITLSGQGDFYTTTPATGSAMARITVKNRTVQELKVVKEGVDGDTRSRLGSVHFALYDQVRDSEGNLRPAYSPKSGYEDLVTDENGILSEITMSVGKGTYYLREKAAPNGYKKLAEDLCFTIGEDGTVSIHNAGYTDWLTRTSDSGTVSYQISIENSPLGITVRKTDEKGNSLPGSKFILCKRNDTGSFVSVTGYGLGQNGLIDLTDKTEMTFTGMSSGIYKLTETDAPSGYIIIARDIYFSVSDGAVTLTDENGTPKTYSDVSLLDDNTTIAVKNNAGAALPEAGGPGTYHITLLGAILMALAGAGIVVMRKKGTS